MKSSQDALNLLKQLEQGPSGGFAATTYSNRIGIEMIGWGHIRHPSDGINEPITEEEAEDLLRFDLIFYESAINRSLDREIHQAQFDALVCFAFDAGIESLGKLISLVNDDNLEEAKKQLGQLKRWDPSAKRSAAERALFEKTST